MRTGSRRQTCCCLGPAPGEGLHFRVPRTSSAKAASAEDPHHERHEAVFRRNGHRSVPRPRAENTLCAQGATPSCRRARCRTRSSSIVTRGWDRVLWHQCVGNARTVTTFTWSEIWLSSNGRKLWDKVAKKDRFVSKTLLTSSRLLTPPGNRHPTPMTAIGAGEAMGLFSIIVVLYSLLMFVL